MLCDGGELWSRSVGQLRSWSVLERKEEGTGGNQRGSRDRGRRGVFLGWKADRIFFRCVEAEQQEQE